jgi:hypothetical protein
LCEPTRSSIHGDVDDNDDFKKLVVDVADGNNNKHDLPACAANAVWTVTSSATGERFDPAKHVPGTEVKAVTYSNLQVVMGRGQTVDNDEDEDGDDNNNEPRCDIWVIVDI